MAEVAKNAKPDIRGEAFNFSGRGIHEEGCAYGRWSVSCNITFEIAACNHGAIVPTLKAVEMKGPSLTPPITFDFSFFQGFGREPAFPVGTEMQHGIGKNMKVRATATVDGKRLAEMQPIVMDDFKVHIVDAFGYKHPIRVRRSERLVFGER
jgi:hypothetical protein